ncbi:MAG: hypothetical protein M0Z71_00880 [Nitrospiraceae bacterium]|nr:hypothetical protein [Nitrospiraceae bacterium]
MAKKEVDPPRKIPVLDILGFGTFLSYNGKDDEMVMTGTRASLLYEADAKFYELAERYNKNERVNVLDFLNCQRQMKARMVGMKRTAAGDKK